MSDLLDLVRWNNLAGGTPLASFTFTFANTHTRRVSTRP